MDIASIASFLLPTLLSMLSGEGKNQENFSRSPKKTSKNMYGYGYRYPRVPRVPLYEDPKYQYKWVRAAIGNRAIADKSEWIKFLKDNNAFETIGAYLRSLGDVYREQKRGLKPSTLKSAEQRAKKIEKAIEALKNQQYIDRVKTELGQEYSDAYPKEAIDALQKELDRLRALPEWKPTGKYRMPKLALSYGEEVEVPKKQGKGLLSGMGYFY
jgi:hypothetical protein